MRDKADVIRSVCAMLSSGDTQSAAEMSRQHYPFLPRSVAGRDFSEAQALRIFLRDGFVDRYSGKRLLFPPVLRVLTVMMPDEFPFQRNWKTSVTHPSYWELFPTLDHIVPIARGGPDDEDNMVSTSMLRNSAKANWTLEELGWSMHPRGDMKRWDGMMAWCIDFVERKPEIARHKYIDRWCRAALSSPWTRNRANTSLD